MRIIDYLMRNAVERVAILMVHEENLDMKYTTTDWTFNLLPWDEEDIERRLWWPSKEEAIRAAEEYLRSELPESINNKLTKRK